MQYREKRLLTTAVCFFSLLGEVGWCPLEGEKCNRMGDFISSQMRRNKKDSNAYFNTPLTPFLLTLHYMHHFPDNCI
jgi:hypothetical protein